MWTRTLRENRVANMVQLQVVRPSHDAALIESGVPSDFSGTPTLIQDESGSLQPETRKMRIGGVGHVHTVVQGDAKVLNHYILLTSLFFIVECDFACQP